MSSPTILNASNRFEYPVMFEQTRARFSEASIAELTESVDCLTDSSTGINYYEAGPRGMQFSEGLEEAGSLLVYELPFANGDSIHKKLTTQALADITNSSVVTVLSPGTGGSKPVYSKAESTLIAKEGDFTPHAERVVRAVDASVRGLAGKVAFMGWSQAGATVLSSAKEAKKDWDVLGVASGDSPAYTDRGLLTLLGDLGKAGYPELRKEIEHSGYSSVLDAFGFTGENVRSDTSRTIEYGRSILSMPILNLTYALGLRHETVVDKTVDLLQSGVPVTLAHAKDSAITTKESFEVTFDKITELIRGQETAKFWAVQFEGNHSAGDNITNLGVLGLFALGKTTLKYK